MSRPPPRDRIRPSLAELSRGLDGSPSPPATGSNVGRLRVARARDRHRRTPRLESARLLPADRSRRPTPDVALARLPTLDPEHTTLLRERGRALSASLVHYLATTRPEAAAVRLEEAATIAADYGRAGATCGLSLNQTAERFLRGRADFLREITVAARRCGLDAGAAKALLETAERAIDRLLVAAASGHGLATDRGPS